MNKPVARRPRKRTEAQRRADAERRQLQAEVAAAQEAKARAEADAQRKEAMLQEQQAREQAAQSAQQAQDAQSQAQQAQQQAQLAQQQVAQSERDKQELRSKLLLQFNRILETRDTVRGLVVNIGDVLFDTGKLHPEAPGPRSLSKFIWHRARLSRFETAGGGSHRFHRHARIQPEAICATNNDGARLSRLAGSGYECSYRGRPRRGYAHRG